jgi:DDE superfamily endonuclease
LHTIQRRCITLTGVKPVRNIQFAFDNYYLYGTIEPTTGEGFFLEMPALDGQCFQVFLDQFAQKYHESLNIMILDRGRFHRAKALRVPKNLVLEFLPAYSPELNPMERLWEDLKSHIALELFENLQVLNDRVAGIIQQYSSSVLQSITGYPYFVQAVNALTQ